MTVRAIHLQYNAERLGLALKARRGDTKQLGAHIVAAMLRPRSKAAQRRLMTYGVWVRNGEVK